jgi:uncharacterized protein YerC
MPDGDNRPKRGQKKSRAGAMPAEPSARAAQQTRVRRVEKADKAPTVRRRGLSPVRAPQSTPSSTATASPATQATPASTTFLALESQPHGNLRSRARRSQRRSSGGSGSTEKNQTQPSQMTRPKTGIKVRLGRSQANAPQAKAPEAVAAAEHDASPVNPLWGLYQEWAGASDQELTTSQIDTTGAIAAAESDAGSDDSLWRMFEEWDSADEAAAQGDAGTSLSTSAPITVGSIVQTGTSGWQRGPLSKEKTAPQITHRTNISDDEIATVQQYRAEKMTWQHISKRTSLSLETLRRSRILGHFGHDANRSVRRFIPTEKQISDVKKYRAEDKSWHEISRLTKIGRRTLRMNVDEGVFGREHQEQSSVRRLDLTEDQIKEVKSLLTENKNWKEIEKETGISKAVLDDRKEKGLFGSEHRIKPYHTPLTEEQISMAKAGLAEGKSDRAIAKSIDLGRDVFQRRKWEGRFGTEYADAEKIQSRRKKVRIGKDSRS